jgi:hypothetical protein
MLRLQNSSTTEAAIEPATLRTGLRKNSCTGFTGFRTLTEVSGQSFHFAAGVPLLCLFG